MKLSKVIKLFEEETEQKDKPKSEQMILFEKARKELAAKIESKLVIFGNSIESVISKFKRKHNIGAPNLFGTQPSLTSQPTMDNLLKQRRHKHN